MHVLHLLSNEIRHSHLLRVYSEHTLFLAENLFLEYVCACLLVSDLLEIRHSAPCMTKFLSLDVFARFLINISGQMEGCLCQDYR